MSDEKNERATPAAATPHDASAPGTTPPHLPEHEAVDLERHLNAGGEVPPVQLKAIIEVLQADLDQARRDVAARDAQLEAADEKVLRSYAEIENMRKRVEREKEEIGKYAITKLARDIVLVADNFERAIASVTPEAKVDNSALTNLLDGVTLTEREFLKTLERHGVRRISPQGEPFNPHLHQAVMEQANPEVPSGTVLQVFQVGYLIEDRVLRPAMVVVSTGGPKAARPVNGNDAGAPGNDLSNDEEGNDGM